jgi:hypothetical protein
METHTMFDLIDSPRYDTENVTISTDTRYTKRGEPRSTNRWAVYVNGRKLHGDLPTSSQAGWVRDMYVEGVPSTDPRWGLTFGDTGKQPSPRSDDMRRARADIIAAESGCTATEAWERAQYEYAHNLLDRHAIAREGALI